MFARLCTTIRWIGTAMFVVVLIVWGVAAMRPIRGAQVDLPTWRKTAAHRFYLHAYREGIFLRSSRSDLLNFGDPRDAGLAEVHDSYELFGVFFRHSDTYRGNGFKQFPVLPRPGEKALAEQPAAVNSSLPSAPFLSSWTLSGHWWHPLALTLPFAARTTQLSIRRRRTRANSTACKSCGYDLRAGHDKCPECGGESHVKVDKVQA